MRALPRRAVDAEALLAEVDAVMNEADALLTAAERLLVDLRADLAIAGAAIRILLPTATDAQLTAITRLLTGRRVVVH